MNNGVFQTDERGKVRLDRTMKIEWSGGNPIYVGWAEPGTASSAVGWKIIKLTWSGSEVTDIQYPNGDNAFIYVWDSRAGYSYS